MRSIIQNWERALSDSLKPRYYLRCDDLDIQKAAWNAQKFTNDFVRYLHANRAGLSSQVSLAKGADCLLDSLAGYEYGGGWEMRVMDTRNSGLSWEVYSPIQYDWHNDNQEAPRANGISYSLLWDGRRQVPLEVKIKEKIEPADIIGSHKSVPSIIFLYWIEQLKPSDIKTSKNEGVAYAAKVSMDGSVLSQSHPDSFRGREVLVTERLVNIGQITWQDKPMQIYCLDPILKIQQI